MLTCTAIRSEPPTRPHGADQEKADDDDPDEHVVQSRGRNTKLTVKHFAAYRLHLRPDAPCGNRMFKCDKLFQVTCCCHFVFSILAWICCADHIIITHAGVDV